MSDDGVILTRMDRTPAPAGPNPPDHAQADHLDTLAGAALDSDMSAISVAVDATAPIRYTYGVTDICAALPSGDVIDIAALPVDLAAKATAHGDNLRSADVSANLIDNRGVIGAIARTAAVLSPPHTRAQLLILCGVYSALLVVLEMVLAPANIALAVLAGAAICGPFAAIGAATVVKRSLGPRTVYTDAEVGQLNDATVIWPIMSEELDAYPNSAVLHWEWEQHAIHSGPYGGRYEHVAGSSGRAALVWREPRLVAVANLIARDIKSSPAWASELFDVHRVRIDLDQTLSDIQFRAYRIWKAHANLVPPLTSDPEDVLARRNDEITLHAEKAWETLTELVRQLYEYKEQLAPIDNMVREIAALNLSSARVTDDAVRQLMVDAAGNTAKAGVVADATVELSELNANLTARLDFLRHALAEPANILPITA